MDDLLKEAIADAKAVRETALANAKIALEEAFTPRLKSMLSRKIEAELSNEEESEDDKVADDETSHDEIADDEIADDEAHMADDETSHDEGEGHDDKEPADDEMMKSEEEDDSDHADDEVAYEGEDDDKEPADDEVAYEGEEEDDDLDLEAVLAELESELKEEDDAYDEKAEATGKVVEPMGEGEESDDEEESVNEEEGDDKDDDAEKVEEQDDAYDENVEGKKDPEHVGDRDTGVAGTPMIKAEALEAELKEYKEAVHFLKDKLHEVNILNAKLLFTNKLFKEYALDNGQKLKVVETFDRAQTTREIKLVYSTLAEQFSDNGSIVTRKSISESASSSVGSTKPSKESRKVISEENQVANRFKKLAGLI
jgi:hypothetical protein